MVNGKTIIKDFRTFSRGHVSVCSMPLLTRSIDLLEVLAVDDDDADDGRN